MATIEDFVEGTTPHEVTDGRVGVAQNILDFTKKNVAASDVVQAVKVKDAIVEKVEVQVLTPEGSAGTFTVGDTTDPDGWDASVDLNAAANTLTRTLEADAYALGVFYDTETTIDLVPSIALTTGKYLVSVFYHSRISTGLGKLNNGA